MKPKVFILILNWNGWKDTIECLDSVYLSSYPDYQIVVLDNGSQDESVCKILEWAKGRDGETSNPSQGAVAKPIPVIIYNKDIDENGASFRDELTGSAPAARTLILIRIGANLGFAGGNNVGLRYAFAHGADYVLLLNNDAFFRSRETLTIMADFMERTPRAGACGGRLFYPDGSPQQSYGNFPALSRTLAYLFPLYKLLPKRWLKHFKRSNIVPDETVHEPLRIDWPSGACLMVSSGMVKEVGLLDEKYFLYVEETDWCFRMQAQGWDRYYLPQAEVIHTFGGSVRNASVSMQCYHLKSQFTYYRKHFSTMAIAFIAVGYMLRSFWSMLYWNLAARLLRDVSQVAAAENTAYWRLAFKLAMNTMQSLVSGDEINSEQRSTVQALKSARQA
jgi:GT2 family glycosyltransferase